MIRFAIPIAKSKRMKIQWVIDLFAGIGDRQRAQMQRLLRDLKSAVHQHPAHAQEESQCAAVIYRESPTNCHAIGSRWPTIRANSFAMRFSVLWQSLR